MINPTIPPGQFAYRKSPRADFWDYNAGDYFVTICIDNMRHCFGNIKNKTIYYNPLGAFAVNDIQSISHHYPYAQLLEYVVMPNHVHAIIRITLNDMPDKKRKALGIVVGGFKQAVTRYAKAHGLEFKWQSRFNDRIIRSWREMTRITEYILSNVENWEDDHFYS